MLKNYKEGNPIGTSGDIGAVERMLKDLDKIIRGQTLEPLNPRILVPFLPTNWEKSHICKRKEHYEPFESKNYSQIRTLADLAGILPEPPGGRDVSLTGKL